MLTAFGMKKEKSNYKFCLFVIYSPTCHQNSSSLYSKSAKTCGFTTKDPVIWIRAFERYYEQQTKLKCEWNKVSNQNQQYSELQLFVHNQAGSKCITIHIYLTTGVILIKGNFWRQWAENEFAIFKTVIDNVDKDNNADTVCPPSVDFLSAVECSGSSKKKISEIQEDNKEGKTETLQLQQELSKEIEVLSIENEKNQSLIWDSGKGYY